MTKQPAGVPVDLTALVAALLAAPKGDEALDTALHVRLVALEKPVPPYTRSFDAAFSLLPEGWSVHHLGQVTNCKGAFAGWLCEVYRARDVIIQCPASGLVASGPLAVCVAALMARQLESKEWRKRRASARRKSSGPVKDSPSPPPSARRCPPPRMWSGWWRCG